MRLGQLVVIATAAGCGGGGTSNPVDGGADGPVSTVDAPPPGTTLFEEHFAGAAWPAGWSELGGVASATVAGGRGALVPTLQAYSLARMGHALDATVDLDVTFTLTMTAVAQQGVGFYVRQNGGYLQQSATHGAGYAVFIEGFRGQQIGLWRERDGVEEELAPPFAPTSLVDNTIYAVRFRCAQAGAMTQLSAKIWPATEPEPAAWTIERTDATPALQGHGGGIAVDSWNNAQSGPTPPPITVDDIVVRAAG